MIMRYLFRTYSKHSNGTNSPSIFAPAAASKDHGDFRLYQPPHLSQALGPQLKAALKGDKTLTSCPFVFWTPSLLFALQWAIFKIHHHEEDIRICCLDTQKARTATGQPVSFILASTLMTQLGIEISNSTGEPREYAGESLSLDCIVPGSGTRIAALADLIQQGLYQLCPVLAEANRRHQHGPKMYRVLADMRAYFPKHTARLSKAAICTAARLALTFDPVQDCERATLPTFLLAGVLALCHRNAQDRTLTDWLAAFPAAVEPADTLQSAAVEPQKFSILPEVSEHLKLFRVCGERAIDNICPSALSTQPINQATITRQKHDWQIWKKQELNRWRALKAKEGKRSEKERSPKRKRKQMLVSDGRRVHAGSRRRSNRKN